MMKTIIIKLILLHCLTLLLLSTNSCSGSCKGSTADSCKKYNNKKVACVTANCLYDESTHMCSADISEQPSRDICVYLGENECKASGTCTYSDSTKSCKEADPSIKGTCAAYQVQLACDDDIRCEWMEKSTPPCRNKTAHEEKKIE